MAKWGLVVLGVVALLAGVGLALLLEPEPDPLTATLATSSTRTGTARLETPEAGPRDVQVYSGHGAWVDVFDFSPAYAGENPPIDASTVSDMAAHGVDTVYLQAARLDDRTPNGIEDTWLLAEWLLRADAADVDVVGWYLPEWSADSADLDRLLAVSDFDVMGRRFASVGVDIEWTADDLEPEERSARLVALSQQLRAATDGDPLGAIVLPPVLIEVVNDQFWPEFPWAGIAPYYDVWLPMSYWSFRSDDSPYKNGYTYNFESIQRLRTNLGNPFATVHAIGGIGAVDDGAAVADGEPLASIGDLDAFAQSLIDANAVGGSIYDWNTMSDAARDQMAALFESGVAAPLDR